MGSVYMFVVVFYRFSGATPTNDVESGQSAVIEFVARPSDVPLLPISVLLRANPKMWAPRPIFARGELNHKFFFSTRSAAAEFVKECGFQSCPTLPDTWVSNLRVISNERREFV